MIPTDQSGQGSHEGPDDALSPFRELIDQIPAILWILDLQTSRLKFISSYAEQLLGYPLGLWMEEPTFWNDHIYPKDREPTDAQRAHATATSEPYDVEYRMIAADGRVLWVREYGRVVPGGNGGSLVGFVVDLSQKRSAQQTLSESKRWLRQIIDTIPQQIWSGPADGTLDFCNARWRSDLGLTLKEIRGDGWQRMLHPDDREKVLKARHESVVNGTPYQQEERHRMADGQYRWFLSRGVPLRDEHGHIVRWFGTNTDIESQKRAEDEVRRSEQRWRAVFDNAQIGVMLMDNSMRIVEVNSASAKMSGYSREEMLSMTSLDFIYEEDRPARQIFHRELLTGKRDRFEIEERYRRKDGGVLWVRVSGSILPAPAGEAVVLIEDITERKRCQDALERERDVLRLLVDLTERFISKLDVNDVIEAVLAGLHELELWKWAAILFPEPSTDRLRVHLSQGMKQGLLQDDTLPIEGTIMGRVYRSGQPLVFYPEEIATLSAEYNRSPLLREAVAAQHLGTGCTLPLTHDGRVLGVLFLGTSERREVSAVELNSWQKLAEFVGAAIGNARLYGELTSSHEKLANTQTYIEEQIRTTFEFENIIGRSKALKVVLQQAHMVASTDSDVLLLGETGTGKELIARAIHDRSARHDQPFIKVDCSAIPATLLESELFGYEKGAFTGAITQKLGRLEIADKGTLLLDEVGDLPLELQSKLLRFLQERKIERLGSNRTLHLDLRIISATNRNLEDLVAKGEFRADLYYRLKVFPITIPPLRDRREDIEPLAWHYMRKYAQRLKRDIDAIPSDMMKVFKHYPWPGNVRELQHFIERSVVLTSGKVLQAPLQELEKVIRERRVSERASGTSRTMEDIERESILQALRESNWVVGGPSGAARKLGLKRTTLASRIERLGIKRPR